MCDCKRLGAVQHLCAHSFLKAFDGAKPHDNTAKNNLSVTDHLLAFAGMVCQRIAAPAAAFCDGEICELCLQELHRPVVPAQRCHAHIKPYEGQQSHGQEDHSYTELGNLATKNDHFLCFLRNSSTQKLKTYFLMNSQVPQKLKTYFQGIPKTLACLMTIGGRNAMASSTTDRAMGSEMKKGPRTFGFRV